MYSFKSSLSLSILILGLIVGMASTHHVEAKSDIKKSSASAWSNEDTAIVLGIIVPAAATLIYFWYRKPLKEERFDKKALKNGPWEKRLKHTWYFLPTKFLAGHTKPAKKYINENGKIQY